MKLIVVAHIKMRRVVETLANFDESGLDVYEKPYKEILAKDEWRASLMKELMETKKIVLFDNTTVEDAN